MEDTQTLQQQVYLYVNFFPGNEKFLNLFFFEELGQTYGYAEVSKEIKRQEKEAYLIFLKK